MTYMLKIKFIGCKTSTYKNDMVDGECGSRKNDRKMVVDFGIRRALQIV
jgi:hypothetical protein